MSDEDMPECEELSDTEIYEFATVDTRASYMTARHKRLRNELSPTPEMPDREGATESSAATNALPAATAATNALPAATNAHTLQAVVIANANVPPPNFGLRQLSRQQTRVVTKCVSMDGIAFYNPTKFKVVDRVDLPAFRVREGDFVLCAPGIKLLAFLLGRVGIVRYVGSEEGSHWAFVEFAAHDVGKQTALDEFIFKRQGRARPLIAPTLNWVPLMIYTKFPECLPTDSTVCDGVKTEEMVSNFVYRNRDGTACDRREITQQDYSH